MHPFLAVERPDVVRAIAHRGGGGPLENTLAQFAQAVELGFRHLETDLHVTHDGTLVIAHDPDLTRIADDPRRIADLTRAELAAVRVAGREPVPTFVELVDAFPSARLTVDLKTDTAVAPMVRLLEHRPELLDRICIGSFASARVQALRDRFGARVLTTATPREILRLLLAVRFRRRPPRIGAGCIAIPERYPDAGRGVAVGDARMLEVAGELELAVHVWTVNDPARMRALVDAGASGIVTDALADLRATLGELGRW